MNCQSLIQMFGLMFLPLETELRDGLESPNLEIKHQERLLASKLAQFLDSDVKYTMKRTSQTELQTMYAGPLAGNYHNRN